MFRIDEHIKRLYDSCKVYRMEVPYSPRELRDAIFDTIRANGFDACYIRPVVYRGLGALGVNPFHSPVEVMIAVWKWGKYLGDEAIEGGVDVCVSSWNRMAPNTFPAMAKATGNYLNSALIKMEAIANGYTEGIALDNAGRISRGQRREHLHRLRRTNPDAAARRDDPSAASRAIRSCAWRATPATPSWSSRSRARCSTSPTRSSSPGRPRRSRRSARSTASSSARGGAARSPKALQKDFFALINGDAEDRYGWLTPVPVEAQVR